MKLIENIELIYVNKKRERNRNRNSKLFTRNKSIREFHKKLHPNHLKSQKENRIKETNIRNKKEI